jgi:hypothetical protein
MDEQSAWRGEQQTAGLGVLDSAAAERQNQRVAGGETSDGRVFAVAERRFAMAPEELSYGRARLRFDYSIDVGKGPTQAAGKERTKRAFA